MALTERQAMDAVRTGKRGVARYGADVGKGAAFATGRIIAYSRDPMVLIETDDGRRVWWRTSFTELEGKKK